MAKQTSIEIKVGMFVLICIAAIVGLVIKFGKLERFSAKTYDIIVVFPNVAGIVRDANVMYAGIPVGKVRDIKLTEEGALKVRLTLAIYEGYKIRKDARFVINQSGLLGDRYVDVVPQSASAEELKPGSEIEGMSSVDLTEAIRSVVDVLNQAAGTIAHIDDAIRRTDAAIKRIDELVLNTQSLTHVSATLANVDEATSNAVTLTASLRSVVDESRASVSNTLAHFASAGDNISAATKRVDDLVVANQDEVAAAAKNLAASAEKLNAILERLNKGEGTAGRLLVDPTLHDELVKLVQNWRRYGILYKDRSSRPETEPPRGKTPEPAHPAQ